MLALFASRNGTTSIKLSNVSFLIPLEVLVDYPGSHRARELLVLPSEEVGFKS